jgi:hypothetical protein
MPDYFVEPAGGSWFANASEVPLSKVNERKRSRTGGVRTWRWPKSGWPAAIIHIVTIELN